MAENLPYGIIEGNFVYYIKLLLPRKWGLVESIKLFNLEEYLK